MCLWYLWFLHGSTLLCSCPFPNLLAKTGQNDFQARFFFFVKMHFVFWRMLTYQPAKTKTNIITHWSIKLLPVAMPTPIHCACSFSAPQQATVPPSMLSSLFMNQCSISQASLQTCRIVSTDCTPIPVFPCFKKYGDMMGKTVNVSLIRFMI